MASLADMRVVRTIETRATTSGVQQTTTELKGLAAAHDGVARSADASATVTESSARRQGSLAGAYERERRALDPLIAAREKYDRTMRNLDRGLDAGRDLGEYTRLAGLAQQRFERMTGANDNLTRSVGLQRHEWINLGRQMQDVGTMAAMGASGMQILSSQAAQVYDVLASSQGGLKGALKEIGTNILGLITPGRAAFAVIAAGAGIAAIAMNRATSQANEFNKALRIGDGLRSGMTRADVEGIVAGSSDFSRSEGRTTALAYAGAGASRANTAAAFGLTRGLADAVYGGDTEAARKGLSDAMRGGTEELLKYVRGVRPLGAATTDYIEKLSASAGEQAAQTELLRLLSDGIKSAAIEVPLWQKALRRLGNVASDLADDFLREGLNRGRTTLSEAQRLANGSDALGGNTAREFAAIGRFLAGLVPEWGKPREDPRERAPVDDARYGRPLTAPWVIRGGGNVGVGAGSAGDSNLGAIIARGQAGSDKLLGLNKTYDAEGEALRKLKLDLAEYDRLLKDNAVSHQMTKEQVEAATKAQKELAGAIESNLSSEEKRRKTDELAIRSINARTDAERTLIAIEQKRLELAGQRISAEDRQRALDAVRDQEVARNAKATADRRLRLDEMNASLKLQVETFGMGEVAAETMRTKQEMLNEATRNGQTIVERYGAGWEKWAADVAKAKVATDDLTKAQQNVIQGMDELRSGSRGTLTGVFSDLRQGRDPMQGIANSLGSMADRMFDRTVSKPLIESLLGSDGKPGGGLFGDPIAKSGLFGSLSGAATGTMTVTAATVVVNGGMGLPAGGTVPIPNVTSGPVPDVSNVGRSVLGTAPDPMPQSLADASAFRGIPIQNEMPSWIGAGTSWFRPALGASNSNAYLPGGSLAGAGEGVSRLVGPMQQQAEAMRSSTDAVQGLGTASAGASGSLGDFASSIGRALGNVGSGAFSLFGPGAAQAAPIGANANGTDYWRGGLSWVGERGPEIMNIPRGAQIVPNHKLDAYLAPPAAAANSNAPPSFTVNIRNEAGARVETGEPKSDGQGGFTLDMAVVPLERKLAGRISSGKGDLRPAVSGQAEGGASFRTG